MLSLTLAETAPVSVQAARRSHRDGRQPAALEATPRVGFKAFMTRKTRAKKRKTTPSEGQKIGFLGLDAGGARPLGYRTDPRHEEAENHQAQRSRAIKK